MALRGILRRLEERAFHFRFKRNRRGTQSAEPVPGVEVELAPAGDRWEVVIYDDEGEQGEAASRTLLAPGVDAREAEVAAVKLYTDYMWRRDDSRRTFGEEAGEGPDVKAIAHEILRQLGGRKFLVMTGAKDLIHAPTLDAERKWPTLSMKLPQGDAKILRIALAPSDTYTVQFLTRSCRVIREMDDIYADQLQDVVAQGTGIALHL